jgi:hypothetical protein
MNKLRVCSSIDGSIPTAPTKTTTIQNTFSSAEGLKPHNVLTGSAALVRQRQLELQSPAMN